MSAELLNPHTQLRLVIQTASWLRSDHVRSCFGHLWARCTTASYPARGGGTSLARQRGRNGVRGVTLRPMGTARNLTAAVHQEEDWYVAQCLEVDVASQGHTIDEALSNLAEAVALYLEEVDDPQRHVTATPLVTSFQVPGAA